MEAAVLGDFVYVADRMTGLTVVDISDPAYPQITSTVPVSGTALGVSAVVQTDSRTFVFVAAGLGGVAVVDVTDSSRADSCWLPTPPHPPPTTYYWTAPYST